MGILVDNGADSTLHGEARTKSFVIFTDFGRDQIELDWCKFHAFKCLVESLETYAPIDGSNNRRKL